MSIEAMKQAIDALNEAVAFREGGRQKAIDAITALRTAIQQAESEAVILWQYRWLNPGNKADASPQELAWKNVDHAWPHLDIASQVESLKGYRFGGKPSYEVRALYTRPAPGVPDDVVRDAISTVREQYRGTDWGKAAECICDAIDAAMTAAQSQKGQP